MTCIEKQQGKETEMKLLEVLIEEKKNCDCRISGITGFICAEERGCYFCSSQVYLIGGQTLSRCGYNEIKAIYQKEKNKGEQK